MKNNKENIIIADCEKEELKSLMNGLEEKTKVKFKIENKICNGKRNFLTNIMRLSF